MLKEEQSVAQVEAHVEALEEEAALEAVKIQKAPKARGRPKVEKSKKVKDERCNLSLQQYNNLGKYKIFFCCFY